MALALKDYLQRRHTLLAQMKRNSAALFFAATPTYRNSDNEYPFRQESNFWYFTGFNEPYALLVLRKTDQQTSALIFNRPKDALAETWTGRRLGQPAALQQLGVEEAYCWDEIAERLPMLLNGLDEIYHAFGISAAADQQVQDTLQTMRRKSQQKLRAPATITDWRPWVAEMRLIKSATEVDIMRQASQICMQAHRQAMLACRPGLYEFQLEAEIQYHCLNKGARAFAYNTIVAGGENGCILHYSENCAQLRAADLVLIDAGCEVENYAADITRTFPVSGKFSPPQRQIYTLVLASLDLALRRLKPGVTLDEVNEEVIHLMLTGLRDLGVLQGDIASLLEHSAHRRFYMHKLGHWLGLDVHDVGDYTCADRARPLQAGMVLTVEPGLYITADANVPTCYHGIGVRIEDNIVITHNGNENLTQNLVKDPDEIEALMATSRHS